MLPSNVVGSEYLGQKLEVAVIHGCSGNSCWSYVTILDYLAPVIICPENLTLSCDEYALFEIVDPTFKDGGCGDDTFEITTDEQIGDCNDDFAYTYTITTIATDASGNVSDPCIQVIYVEKDNFNDLTFPIDYDGLPGNEEPLACDGGFAVDANGHPSPIITGSPGGLSSCGNIVYSYTDVILPICAAGNCGVSEASYKIVRTWSAVELCTNAIIETEQIIKIMDLEAPVIDPISDLTVGTDDFGCGATINLPFLSAVDNCSTSENITYSFSSDAGQQEGNSFILTDPSKTLAGTPIVISVTASDCCGNSSSITFNVTVVDMIPPTVIANMAQIVSLNSNGVAQMNADNFDDGSYDNCGQVGFSIKRVDDGPFCNYDEYPPFGNDNGQFNEAVFFCCSDVSDEPVLVWFQVCDDANMV